MNKGTPADHGDSDDADVIYADDEDDRCEDCGGLGDDKWCDGLLPCQGCGGSGRRFGL